MPQFLKKHWIALLISLSLIVAVVFIFHAYTTDLESTQYQTVLTGAKEIAAQQEKAIEIALQGGIDRLHDTAETIHLLHQDDMHEVQSLLNVSAAVTDFDTLALIDDAGTIYTDSYRTVRRQDIRAKFDSGEDAFIVRFDDAGERAEDSLFFGCRHEMMIGDKKIIGIFGRVLRSKLDELLQSTLFNGDGYTAVLDQDGMYIAAYEANDISLQKLSIYDDLADREGITDNDLELLRAAIENANSFNFSYTEDDGSRRIALLYPLKNAEASILIVIPYDIYGSVVDSFTEETTLLFVFIAVCFVAIGIYAVSSARRSAAARAAMDAGSGFLSTMSHEIRTPLNGIIGLNSLMAEHLDDREKLEIYTQKMDHTAQYLLSLVSDILDVSKLQQGQIELDLAPVSLESIMDGIASIETKAMEDNELRFSVNRQIRFPYVLTDAVRLQQILINIIDNAAKYTPQGGQVRVEVSQTRIDTDTAMNKFVIADTGVGIPRDVLEHIFDLYTQERDESRTEQKVSGLGLTISHKLAQALHGDIQVESEVGKGTIFTVTIPARITDQDALAAGRITELDDRPLDHRLRLLVAEDNELNGEILMEILEEAGLYADWARNGGDAVDKFRKSAPFYYDVILMDIQMPVLNGYDAARRIRRMLRDDADTVKIYACTANSFKEDMNEALAAGMNDFITKPVDINKLYMKLSGKTGKKK